jgi:hypothetical protein
MFSRKYNDSNLDEDHILTLFSLPGGSDDEDFSWLEDNLWEPPENEGSRNNDDLEKKHLSTSPEVDNSNTTELDKYTL